jgi:hypothetical protein
MNSPPDPLERLLREIRPLRFAVSDMRQTIAAAQTLAAERENGDLRHALETAIAVCYARPWCHRGGLGALAARWLPSPGASRVIHDALLRFRHQVYAHSDGVGSDGRGIIDVWQFLGFVRIPALGEFTHFTEQWYPIPREWLLLIIELATTQQRRFEEGLVELTNEVTVLGLSAPRTPCH